MSRTGKNYRSGAKKLNGEYVKLGIEVKISFLYLEVLKT